jgi:segregation and condensation protein B
MTAEPAGCEQSDESALLSRLEAVLIVGDGPVSTTDLAAAIGASTGRVEAALSTLRDELDGRQPGGRRHGMELRRIAGGWQYAARADYDGMLTAFVEAQAPVRLSQAALETLAIIAYRQPIARGQIAEIRAVNVDSVVRTLQERGFIAEAFRDPETGAAMFETTPLLLSEFGIDDLSQLPAISPLLPDAADVRADAEDRDSDV